MWCVGPSSGPVGGGLGDVSCGDVVTFSVREIVPMFVSVCMWSATRWPCGSLVVCVTERGAVRARVEGVNQHSKRLMCATFVRKSFSRWGACVGSLWTVLESSMCVLGGLSLVGVEP